MSQKLGRTGIFMKCHASVVSLIFLPKTLIWNKTRFLASISLTLAEVIVNEPMKSISKQQQQQQQTSKQNKAKRQYLFFYRIYHCLP